jgi:hypothetical protein
MRLGLARLDVPNGVPPRAWVRGVRGTPDVCGSSVVASDAWREEPESHLGRDDALAWCRAAPSLGDVFLEHHGINNVLPGLVQPPRGSWIVRNFSTLKG